MATSSCPISEVDSAPRYRNEKRQGLSVHFDEAKLRAYHQEYGYRFAHLLVVRTGKLDPGLEPPRAVSDEVPQAVALRRLRGE